MSERIAKSLVRGFLEDPPIRVSPGGGLHVDPKAGIARLRPRSLDWPKRHPDPVRVGIVGTAESVDRKRQWLESVLSRSHLIVGQAVGGADSPIVARKSFISRKRCRGSVGDGSNSARCW